MANDPNDRLPERPQAADPWGQHALEDPDRMLDAYGRQRRVAAAPPVRFTVEVDDRRSRLRDRRRRAHH